jgi:hypothetical protein
MQVQQYKAFDRDEQQILRFAKEDKQEKQRQLQKQKQVLCFARMTGEKSEGNCAGVGVGWVRYNKRKRLPLPMLEPCWLAGASESYAQYAFARSFDL